MKEIPDCSVDMVLTDPPYGMSYQSNRRTTTDKFSKISHDNDLFWSWCSSLVDSGCNVLVSEYTAPPNWIPVWGKEVTNSLTKDTGSKRGVEKLFMRYK